MRKSAKLMAAVATAGLAVMGTNQATAFPPMPVGVDGVIGPEWSAVTPTLVPVGPAPDAHLVAFNVYVRADANFFYVAAEALPAAGDMSGTASALGLADSANVYLDTDQDGSTDIIIEALAGRYCKAIPTGCDATTGPVVIGDPAAGPNVFSVGSGSRLVPGVREIAMPWSTLRGDPDGLGFTPVVCSVQVRTVQAFGFNFSGSQFPGRFGTVSQPACTPTALDHFKCYKVVAKGTSKLDPRPIVELEDQFGEELGVRVDHADVFCNPVVKNAEGELEDLGDQHLTCYNIKGGKEEHQVQIENQFGPQDLRLKEAKLLCVPTEKLGFQAGN